MSDRVVRKWYATDVTVRSDAADAVESAFAVLDAIGTEVDSLRKRPDEPVVVTGFFDQPLRLSSVRQTISDALESYDAQPSSVSDISQREVVEEDWLAEWKRHWKPTEIGRMVIAPPWSNIVEDGKIIIRIEPNMAFGTGTHDTTKLCLAAIEEFYRPGNSLLDVGTGTGILAIAAAKLDGRSIDDQIRIYACDTDPDSVRIARENAAANLVDARIEFADGAIDENIRSFDVVCANLTLDVIDPILPLLCAKAHGTLILSGILAEQEPEIRRSLAKLSFADPDIRSSGEWIAVVVTI